MSTGWMPFCFEAVYVQVRDRVAWPSFISVNALVFDFAFGQEKSRSISVDGDRNNKMLWAQHMIHELLAMYFVWNILARSPHEPTGRSVSEGGQMKRVGRKDSHSPILVVTIVTRQIT